MFGFFFEKLAWFRSSTGGGFAEIKGVDGPYYQPSADDVGMHICIKCTLAGAALSFGGTGGLSPAGKGKRGRHARGGGSRVPPQSPQRHQAQVTFAEVRAMSVLVLRSWWWVAFCLGVSMLWREPRSLFSSAVVALFIVKMRIAFLLPS